MTAHELARKLLEMPDIEVKVFSSEYGTRTIENVEEWNAIGTHTIDINVE